MANSFRKVIYVLVPILAYYVVHDLTRLLCMFLLQLIAGRSREAYTFFTTHDALTSGIISVIDILVGIFVLLLIMRSDKEELSIWDYVNLNGLSFYRRDRIHKPVFSWVILVLQAVSMSLGINILIRLSGIIQYSSYNDSVSVQFAVPLWLGLLLYGVISPLAEELLFRLIVFGRLKRRFNILLSGIVASLFFGLYHGNLVQGIYGFVMGLLMCLACEYVHSIFGALLIHCIANVTIYLLGLNGVLSGLGDFGTGVALICFGLVTVFFEIWFSHKTVTEYGDIEGITYVGGFYIDPSYEEENPE